MWFSEGYATFMQYKLLALQGVLSEEEASAKCKKRLSETCAPYDSERPFLEVYSHLRSRYDYPGVYWGGACYFFQIDKELKERFNVSLLGVIKKYQQDGRMADDSMEEVIESLDRISESRIFSSMFERMMNEPARQSVHAYIEYVTQ